MTRKPFEPTITQVALSVVDLRRTERWFREGLGFLPSGGSRPMLNSPLLTRVQGLPGVASTAWWMVGRDPWVQLELFQFRRPIAKLLPADFQPCDIGYTRIGVVVADFDATLAQLKALGTEPLARPIGVRGARRACVRSPDGVFVELMEDDPLGTTDGSKASRGKASRGKTAAGSGGHDAPVAVRSVTLSTPDLARSITSLTAVCGHGPDSIVLHGPKHEALWGLPGANCERAVFRAGQVLVEAVQYLEPRGRPRPASYRICDQGILNVAFGAGSRAEHDEVMARAKSAGAKPTGQPVHTGKAGLAYVDDALGFSIEILWMGDEKSKREWGYEPLPLSARPDPDNQRVEARVLIAAPRERVWEVLDDDDGMSAWIGFDPVRRTRAGAPDPDGYGAEREMHSPGGVVVEQITGVEPLSSIRYRIIKGSPFTDHNGEVELRSAGKGTEVHWTVRFRGRVPLPGNLWQVVMQRWITGMVKKLKAHVERPD